MIFKNLASIENYDAYLFCSSEAFSLVHNNELLIKKNHFLDTIPLNLFSLLLNILFIN